MINTARALNEFWSGFGLWAFAVNTVPDEDPDGNPMKPPYITYSLVETEPLEPATHYAQVWYRDTGYADHLAKVDEIKAAIGDGVKLECDGGYVVLRPLSPLAQTMTDEDTTIKYTYINLQINCYHV